MKVSIIIVSWNTKKILADCLDSINKSSFSQPYEIIVVDNASSDETSDYIKNKYPSVRLISNTANKGFAFANNQGAEIAKGKYLFFLNPDTILFEDTLNNLIEFMDKNPDIAMCGPKILNDDLTIQKSVRNFPSWKAAFYRYTFLKYFGIFKSKFNHWHNRSFNYEIQSDVEQIIGAAILTKKNIFYNINCFDERFFMYYEEVDLCHRLVMSGNKIVYFPNSKLIHLGGKSAKQIPATTRFMTLKSLLIYLQKNTQFINYKILSLLFKFGVLIRQLSEFILNLILYYSLKLIFKKTTINKFKDKYRSSYDFLINYFLKFLLC